MRARLLVTEARRMLREGDAGWSVGVVILARKALEATITEVYQRREKTRALVHGTWRDKLVCLPHYLREGASPHPLAARVAWCWSALSDASHHRGLEMTPSAQDLTAWLDTVESLVAHLEAG